MAKKIWHFGVVTNHYPADGYDTIETESGETHIFSRHQVSGTEFDDIPRTSKVRFTLESCDGEERPADVELIEAPDEPPPPSKAVLKFRKMQDKFIPVDLWEHFDRETCFAYSYDAKKDGSLGALLIDSGDPEHPELWIYDIGNDEVSQVGGSDFLADTGLGKAFWADNQRDLVIVSRGGDDFWLVTLDPPEMDWIEPSRELKKAARRVKGFN